jgi:hypothetical protein
MKYTIHWLEFIYPDSYCEDLDLSVYELDERVNKEEYDKVLNAILEHLPPNSKHSGGYFDCWEFECRDTFVARTLKEAKEIASEYECGQEGIFNVVDENNNRAFTEEDL